MGPLSPVPPGPGASGAGGATLTSTQDVAWLRIEHASSVGAARRAAVALAERLGLSGTRVAELEIVVTELAGNQLKHAGGGLLVLRACRRRDESGVEVVALDRGPGMRDLVRSFADGQSTSGTLGIGLGAVARLSTTCDGYSAPERGTVLRAAFGPGGVTRGADGTAVAGLTRPIGGETVCGDAYGFRLDGGFVSALLVDGLGHGPLAAHAAGVAVRAFDSAPPGSPGSLLTAVHRALAGTRGAAAAVLQHGVGQVSYAGIGNVTGWVIGGEHRLGLSSLPGIAGGHARAIREQTCQLPRNAVVVMHSDGVTDRMDFAGRAGVLGCSPVVIAALVMRDFGIRNDDAGVVVLRAGGSG